MENLTPGCANCLLILFNEVRWRFLQLTFGLLFFLSVPLVMALDTSPHWENINGSDRYGYWTPGVQSGYWDYSTGAGHYESYDGHWEYTNGRYEIVGSHMETVGRWDYSSGLGHYEWRELNGRWEYDSEGNPYYVEDSEMVWVEDPVWIEENVSVNDYGYVEDSVWVPGGAVWVDDPIYVDQSTPDSWVDMSPPENPQPPDSPGGDGCGCDCDIQLADQFQVPIGFYDSLYPEISASLGSESDTSITAQISDSVDMTLWELVAKGDVQTLRSLLSVSSVPAELARRMLADAQKIDHIFNDSKHYMPGFLSRLGLGPNQTTVALDMIREALQRDAAKISAAANSCGIFNRVPLQVGGEMIGVSGKVVEGVPRLGTAFIPQ